LISLVGEAKFIPGIVWPVALEEAKFVETTLRVLEYFRMLLLSPLRVAETLLGYFLNPTSDCGRLELGRDVLADLLGPHTSVHSLLLLLGNFICIGAVRQVLFIS
jgi:hypothetical protein